MELFGADGRPYPENDPMFEPVPITLFPEISDHLSAFSFYGFLLETYDDYSTGEVILSVEAIVDTPADRIMSAVTSGELSEIDFYKIFDDIPRDQLEKNWPEYL